MSKATYRYAVGKFSCIIVSDGELVDPGETFGLNCLYIRYENRNLLLDTGCGNMFQGTTGHLLSNLAAEGIKPADIDTIIFDHGHIDHVCGTFGKSGKPVFPNAGYIMPEKEWRYIEAGPTDSETQNNYFHHARKYLLPMKTRFKIVDDNYEILPGLRFVPAYGHTPGNSMLDISSGGERLLCIGDVIHSQQELVQPDHCASFDVAPEQAIRTWAEILAKLAEARTPVFATHFTFPGLGYFRKKHGRIYWEAI